MVIQHNLPALNALRQKTINNANTSNNLEKLSSGYKVNHAADDAAGLAISEKMRGQIRGLDMAVQNTQNGVSLIQTAEGGLNEIHAILHRMRELSVQAANGTYVEEDRQQINKEVQALKSEIDRISSATNYNGITLLDGTLGGHKPGQLPGTKLPGETLGNGDYYPGTYAAYAESLKSLGFSVGATNTNPTKVAGTVGITSYNSDFDGENARFVIISQNESGEPLTNISLQVGDKTYLSRSVSNPAGEKYTDIYGKEFTIPQKYYVFCDDDGNLVATLENRSGSSIEMLGSGYSGAVAGIPMPDNDVGSVANPKPTGFKVVEPSDPTGPAGNAVIDDTFAIKDMMIGTEKDKLELQIGANGHADQRVGFGIPNMSSANLGTKKYNQYDVNGTIAGISIMSPEAANVALDVIDAAVMQVSGVRANLGAMQNRLEHAVNNLGVTRENLQAAESSIRDVDMAKEMMDFQKNNILNEASQAMLAQANQLPQGVLQLLR
ncbi:MAG: hypothetical protein LBV27_07075 [Oscillospiraceae bacterium]|nr:hypothetical protein [Oscillospiraceae bacterium]